MQTRASEHDSCARAHWQLALRDGTAISTPISFETLYGRCGESWRVPSKESLLNACGGEAMSSDDAAKVYVNFMPPVVSETQVTGGDQGGAGDIIKKWWWLILLLIFLVLFLILRRKT
jgi:hypothetical protein